MVFSSLLFVFFFLSLNLLSQRIFRTVRSKNGAMLVFSLVFYGWAGPRYLPLLLGDTLIAWFFALRIQGSRKPAVRKTLLALGAALLLLVLGVFKYAGFLTAVSRNLFGFPETVPDIALPVGISFYTFQLLSYMVDVYREEIGAQKRYGTLLLYASLFHQCIAGPIVRYADVENDIRTRKVTAREISSGITRFSVGLAKKSVLANSCAVIADRFLTDSPSGLAAVPASGLWLGAFAFLLQIYLDFSAYSDMAIGMGRMTGFHYRENFNYPYAAGSVTEFWRRWHISLSTFFRDYLYIPLGGNRCSVPRQILNLFVVWGLTGLWHGASWNFVVWGLYFFVFLILEKFVLADLLPRIPGILRHLGLLAVVYFSWIIFRFTDFSCLFAALRGLFCGNGNPATSLAVRLTFLNNWALLLVSTVAVFPVGRFFRRLLRRLALGKGPFWRAAETVWETLHPVFLLLLSSMALAGDSYNPFLYFRF